MPICPEPGCGRPMVDDWRQTIDGVVHWGFWKCIASPDQHRISALEAELAGYREVLVQAFEREAVIRADLLATRKELEEAKWRDDREAKVHKEWLEKELSKAHARIKELEARQRGKTGEGAE